MAGSPNQPARSASNTEMNPAAVSLLLFLSILPLRAAESEPGWMVLNHAAHQAREAKDYTKPRDALAELRPLLPGDPRLRRLKPGNGPVAQALQQMVEIHCKLQTA